VQAAKAGKDVYCEKPMGLCLGWDLALRDAVRRYGRVFQYGTQALSYHNVRRCCEMVRSGYIGDVREVQVSCGPGAQGQTDAPQPVPEDLDYDLWLGPAAWRPYFGQPLTQGSWIHIYDYSVGWIGGMGAHSMAAAMLGFDTHTRGPLEVEATGEVSRGVRDTLHRWQARIRFADGTAMTFSAGGQATRFVGTSGWLEPADVVYGISSGPGGGIRASSAALARAPERPGDVSLGRARGGHGGEFIRAVKDRGPTTVGVDLALRSEVFLHLTDIAVRTGKKITWDPVTERIMGDDEANRRLWRPMREPWRL
jgi:predicted dehydrogenase